jgi:hypothetical protein
VLLAVGNSAAYDMDKAAYDMDKHVMTNETSKNRTWDVGKGETESKEVEIENSAQKSKIDVGVKTETPAGETETEVEILKEGKTPVVKVKHRMNEELIKRMEKYTPIKNHMGEKALVIAKEQLKLQIRNNKEACISAAKAYDEAREMYIKAKQEGIHTLEKARAMMHAGTNYAHRWLDRIELQVMNSEDMGEDTKLIILEKIDEYRDKINEKINSINETGSIEEMKAFSRELDDCWGEIRLFIKSVVYQLAAAKLETIIEKAEDVELRLEEKIEEMRASGEDTSKLEERLAEYRENVELAREKVEEAEDVLLDAVTIEEIREGQGLVTEALAYLKQAFKDVKLILKEYKKGWVFFGNKTGELFARGDGRVEIQGTGIVVAKGNGTVIVDPHTAVKASTGFGVKSTGNGITEIRGRGVVVVRGENITVTIEGTELKVFAKGQGSAYLEGNGTYKVKKLPKYNMTEGFYEGSLTIEFGGEE